MQKFVTWFFGGIAKAFLELCFQGFLFIQKVQEWYSGLTDKERNNVNHNFQKGIIAAAWLVTSLIVKYNNDMEKEELTKENQEVKFENHAMKKQKLEEVLKENEELKERNAKADSNFVKIARLQEQLKNKKS